MTIKNTTLMRNTVTGGSIEDPPMGGGLYADSSNLVFNDVTVRRNEATDSFNEGAGVVFVNSDIRITESTFRQNVASGDGGALSAVNTAGTVTSSQFRKNEGDNGGAIALSDSANIQFSDVIISKNVAWAGGGIACNPNSVPKFTDVTVLDNRSYHSGGGVSIANGCNAVIHNSTIANNSSNRRSTSQDGFAGGIYIYEADPSIKGVSVVSNAATRGGAVYVRTESSEKAHPSAEHVTIVDNRAPKTDGFRVDDRSSITVSRANIVSNGFGAYSSNTNSKVNAAENWWGHSSGPSAHAVNPDGQGDSTNAFVEVTPFLAEPDTAAPPIPPQEVQVESQTPSSLQFSWASSKLADFDHFTVHYDSDTTGYRYDYKNSVDVGADTSYTLTGLQSGEDYYIAVTTVDDGGEKSWYSQELHVRDGQVVSIPEEESTMPTQSQLKANYPNPFNPSTAIRYVLAEQTEVELRVLDVLGREVRTLVDQSQSPGQYEVNFKAEDLPSGTYLYRLEAGDFTQTRTMMLVK